MIEFTIFESGGIFYFSTISVMAILYSWFKHDYIRKIVYQIQSQNPSNLIAMSIGLGILYWSMIVIGIIGFTRPFTPKLDIVLLVISGLFSIVGSLFTFYILSSKSYSKISHVFSGLIFSVSLIAAQFTGIFSLKEVSNLEFDWTLILLASGYVIIIPILNYFLIIHHFTQSNQWRRFLERAAISVVFGSFLIGVQYTMLESVSFVSRQAESNVFDHDTSIIALFIGIAAIFIFVSFINTVYVDRKRIIEQKNLVNEKFRSLFHLTPNLVLELDRDGIVKDVNQSFLTYLGYSKKHVLDEHVTSLFPVDEQEKLSKLLHDTLSNKTDYMEMAIIRKNGKPLEAMFTFIPIHQLNRVVGTYLVAKDITEKNEALQKQYEAEEELQKIIKNQLCITLKVKKVDNQFLVVLAGGQLLYNIGLDRSFFEEKTLEELLEKQDQYHNVLKHYEKSWQGEEVAFEGTIMGRDALSFLKPVKKSGKVVEIINTIVDITDQKLAEQEMLVAKEEADKANNAKSEFLSKMSHELRTPLNGVLGFAQVLQMDKDLNETHHAYLKEIFTAGNHLLQLINSVLDLTRMETDPSQITLKEVALNEILQESTQMIKPIADDSSIEIISDFDLENPVVLGNNTKLRQIFLNLLENAIKYNQPNGQVVVKTYQEDNNVCVQITDSGIGISHVELDKVFEPFYRIMEEGSNVSGAGIGLALVKQLVEQLNGTIQLESKVGKGTSVQVRLPLIDTIPVKKDNNNDILQQMLEVSTSTILYIEDNPMNQQLVKKVLDHQHVNLLIASNGIDGINLFVQEKVDIILLDMDLPDVDGLDVVDVIRHQEKSNVPIIAISANAIKEDMVKALSYGCNDYMTKPIDVSLLYKKLNEYLQ